MVAAFPEADAIKIKAEPGRDGHPERRARYNLTASLTTVSPTPTTTNGVVSYSATFSLAKLPANARMGQTANVVGPDREGGQRPLRPEHGDRDQRYDVTR